MKILLIGNFNEKETNLVNGQTIKSDLIYEALKEKFNVERINTNLLKTNFFSLLYRNILKIVNSQKIIVMLGKNGLNILFPVIYIIAKILKKDIYYIVIGGWLASKIRKNLILKYMLKRIDKIFVECYGMQKELNEINCLNVDILYNFRDTDFLPKEVNNIDKKYENMKLIFYSRIIEEKGIYDLIEVIKKINTKDEVVTLDIYGPIGKYEKLDQFLDKNIKYKGIISKDKYQILNKYDLMVFPTYYSGEGQAGVIVEAMISNLPILASDWKYNSEFISDNETGFLFKARDKEDLEKKIKFINDNRELLKKIKKNMIEEKNKYTKEEFLKKLEEFLR